MSLVYYNHFYYLCQIITLTNRIYELFNHHTTN
nr:MAG TPA: hypothetical protein [Crassvirales sp.]